MINSEDGTKENKKEHNPNSNPQVLDHPYKILLIGDSGCGKINALFNLITHQPNTDKTYLYAKNSYETKYQLLINKQKKSRIKVFK